MVSTYTDDRGIVIEFADGGREVLHSEEYLELLQSGNFKIVEIRTEFERSKPMPTFEERHRYKLVAAYWQQSRETAKRCQELLIRRRAGRRVGYLPKRVNDSFDRLSEAAQALGYQRLDSRIRCQLEQAFCEKSEACRALTDEYAGKHISVPMSEFYSTLSAQA